MYLQDDLSAIWLRLLTEPDAGKRQAAQDLVEVVSRMVFVDEAAQNWTDGDLLPTQPFLMHGRHYGGIPLGKDVDIDTIEYLKYDYDGIELFLLRPGDPVKEKAPIAVRRTLNRSTDHQLLDLARLQTSFLQEIHGRILQVVPARYSKEHRELRLQVQREVAAQQNVV